MTKLKKTLISAFIAISVISLFILAGCSQNEEDKYFLPSISCETNGYMIEHVTNIEEDVEICDDNKLSHEAWLSRKEIQFAWIIKKNSVIVGWIDFGGGYGYTVNKDGTKYGYGFYSKDKKHFDNGANLCVFMIGKDEDFIAEHISVTADFCTVSFSGTSRADDRGGVNFGSYILEMQGREIPESNTFNITVDIL